MASRLLVGKSWRDSKDGPGPYHRCTIIVSTHQQKAHLHDVDLQIPRALMALWSAMAMIRSRSPLTSLTLRTRSAPSGLRGATRRLDRNVPHVGLRTTSRPIRDAHARE